MFFFWILIWPLGTIATMSESWISVWIFVNDLNSKELEILNVTKHTRQQSQIVAFAQIQ